MIEVMHDYHQLQAWKDALSFVKEIYDMTKAFPNSEIYGLCSQIQRAAVSIPSNIAEGCSRSSKKEYRHFLEIALGSAYEVESQLRIAQMLDYLSEAKLTTMLDKIDHIQRMLSSLINYLNES